MKVTQLIIHQLLNLKKTRTMNYLNDTLVMLVKKTAGEISRELGYVKAKAVSPL